MLSGILFGIPHKQVCNTNFKIPIVNILAISGGPLNIMNVIKDQILPKLNDDYKHLYNNIPESIIGAAGLKEH